MGPKPIKLYLMTEIQDYKCQPINPADPFTICVPQKRFYPQDAQKNSFYAAVPKTADADALIANIRRRFGNNAGDILPAEKIPNGVDIPGSYQLFDITNILPPFISENSKATQDFPGPNCYYTALKTAGIINDEPRYVDGMEFSYYLTVSAQIAPSNQPPPFGSIVVFSPTYFSYAGNFHFMNLQKERYCTSKDEAGCIRMPGLHGPTPIITKMDFARNFLKGVNSFHFAAASRLISDSFVKLNRLYDEGVHAAFYLGANLLFHKRGFRSGSMDVYEAAPFDYAMYLVDAAAFYFMDKFERLGQKEPTPEESRKSYKHLIFIKRDPPITPMVTIPISEEGKIKTIQIFDYYSERLRQFEKLKGDEFKNNRMPLMTMENIWHVLSKFRDQYLKMSPSNLLMTDPDVAQAYLRLHSLSWQYEAMKGDYVDKYIRDEIRAVEYLKALYKERYFIDDAVFQEELALHMASRNVPSHKWETVRKLVMDKIMERLPMVKEAASEGVKVPFFQILDEAIAAASIEDRPSR